MYSVQTGTTLYVFLFPQKDHFWFVSVGQSGVEQEIRSLTLIRGKETLFQDIIALN